MNIISKPFRVVSGESDYELRKCKFLGLILLFLQFGVVLGATIGFVQYRYYQNEDIGVSVTYARLNGVDYNQHIDDGNYEIANILKNIKLGILPNVGDGFFVATKIVADDEHSCKTYKIGRRVENISAFITNHVYFSKWNKTESNIISNITFEYLKNCSYDREKDKNCPVFKIGKIVALASDKYNDPNSSIWDNGGVITIHISWQCNYDNNDNCTPEYSFHRIDTKYQDKYQSEDMATRGYNFRCPRREEKYCNTAVYGIRFSFVVNATANKFDFKKTVINLGSLFGWITSGWGILIYFYFCCLKREVIKVEPTKCC